MPQLSVSFWTRSGKAAPEVVHPTELKNILYLYGGCELPGPAADRL